MRARYFYASIALGLLLGLLALIITGSVVTSVLSAGAVIPLILVALRRGYHQLLAEKAQASELKDVEELLLYLANSMRLGYPPERALLRFMAEARQNRIARQLSRSRSLMLRGTTAERILRNLASEAESPLTKELLTSARDALRYRSSRTVQTLTLLSRIARNHRMLLEDFDNKLRAQRIKVRMLIAVNSSALGMLSMMLSKLGALSSKLSLNYVALTRMKLPIILVRDPQTLVAITLVYSIIATITAYYISYITREASPHRSILLSIISFMVTYMALNALLP